MIKLKNQLQPTVPAALLGGLKLLSETDLRQDLEKITLPSLHLFGQLDTIVPAALVPLLAPRIPHGQCHLLPRTGHLLFLTQPDQMLGFLNHLILRFP